MMRSLVHPEPEMVRLCREGRWDTLLERLATSPLEPQGHSVVPETYQAGKPFTHGSFSASLPLLQVAIRASCHHHSRPTDARLPGTSLPLGVMHALIRTNPHQLAIINQWTGTLLHEAIQYRCSNQVIDCLLQCLLEYEAALGVENVPSTSHAIECEAWHSSQAPSNRPHLLGVQDDIGRTALHCMILRWQRSHLDSDHATSLGHVQLFQRLLEAYPPAVAMVDADGHSPLLMLLQTTIETTATSCRQEIELQRMVHAIVALDPSTARHVRQVPPDRGLLWNNSDTSTAALATTRTTSAAAPPSSSWTTHVKSSFKKAPGSTSPSSSSLMNAVLVHQCQYQQRHSLAASLSLLLQKKCEASNNGDGTHNSALYYALLYGRSAGTVKLLLDAASDAEPRTAESRGSPVLLASLSSVTIVTPYHEVNLHIAVSTSAPLAVMEYVVHDNPWAVTVCDVYNLTPLDWLWICHVRDWPLLAQQQHQQQNPPRNPMVPELHNATPRSNLQTQWRRLVSGRRHVPRLLLDLHKLASAHVPALTEAPSVSHGTSEPGVERSSLPEPGRGFYRRRKLTRSDGTRTIPPPTNIHPELILRHQDELWCRMKVLVIAAAESYAALEPISRKVDPTDLDQSWSFLHAVCYVPCPRAMVRLVLLRHSHSGASESTHFADPQLKRPDLRAGRLPLHYAAGRVGYTASFSTGFSGTVQVIQESSPVFDIVPNFPEACRVADKVGQIPLHIAIDAFKHHRVASEDQTLTSKHDEDSDEEDSVLRLLLDRYPSALERRDGKTKLYPWQQAAVGKGSRLSTVFFLLRSNPALCATSTS